MKLRQKSVTQVVCAIAALALSTSAKGKDWIQFESCLMEGESFAIRHEDMRIITNMSPAPLPPGIRRAPGTPIPTPIPEGCVKIGYELTRKGGTKGRVGAEIVKGTVAEIVKRIE